MLRAFVPLCEKEMNSHDKMDKMGTEPIYVGGRLPFRRSRFERCGGAIACSVDCVERAACGVDASYTLLSLLCIDIWCRTFLDGIRSVSAQ